MEETRKKITENRRQGVPGIPNFGRKECEQVKNLHKRRENAQMYIGAIQLREGEDIRGKIRTDPALRGD